MEEAGNILGIEAKSQGLHIYIERRKRQKKRKYL
jgi:hypothetical protein